MGDPHDEPLVPPQGLGMSPTSHSNNQPYGREKYVMDIAFLNQ